MSQQRVGCPGSERLAEFASGSGSAELRESIEQHLDGCADCRRVVSEVANLEPTQRSPGDVAPVTALPAGTLVGRYEVRSVAGAGGMGVIYTAHDPTLHRTVALKLVRPGRTTDGAARLLAEAKVMAKLAHPDVLPVFDAGTFGADVFIAMEWVDGQTLRAWLAQQPRSWREVLDVFLHAGRGLAAAHQAGIIHRDFKPENVLVGRDGRVRVSDFGLARELHGEAVGGVSAAGTLAYMAPEQFAGTAITPAVDQYSFCVALAEALTGSRPTGTELRSLPGPRWLRRAVERGLQREPSRRFPSMQALLAALSPRSSSLRWALAASALVVLGVGAWRLAMPSAVELCAGSGAKLEAVWNPARRQALLTNAKDADRATLTRVADLLDGFASRWTTARQQACVATHVHKETSEQVLDLEMSCFQQRLVGVDALLNALSTSGTSSKAIEAAQQAISVQRCTDVAYLSAASGGELDPEARARSAQVRERMARVRQQLVLGPFKEAGLEAAKLVTDAKTLGVRAVEAEAHLLNAQALQQLRAKPEESAAIEVQLDEAVLAGTESKYPHVVVEAWLERMRLCTQDARFEDALKHERMAAAHLQSLGVDAWLQARHDQLNGSLLMRLARVPEALAAFAHGLQSAATLPEAETARLRADLVSGEALALIFADEFKSGRAKLEQAVTLAETAYGERYQRLGEFLYNLGGLEQQTGRLEESMRLYDRALAIWAAAYGPETPRIGIVETSRADVLSLLGRFDEARETLTRTRALFTRAGLAKEYFFMRVLCAEGDIQRRAGDLEASARAFRDGLELAATAKGQFPFDAPMCRVAMSHTLFAQGRFDEARAQLDEATRGLARSPVRLAGARIAMARLDVREGKGAAAKESLESSLALLEQQDLEPALRALARVTLAKTLEPGDSRSEALVKQASDELAAGAPGEAGLLK